MMNLNIFKPLFLVAAGGLLVSGCTFSPNLAVREPPTAADPSGEILPVLAREKPQQHAVITPGGQTNIWLSTYWIHADSRWIRVPAHVKRSSRSNEIWVSGHRSRQPNGEWIWRSGHWEAKPNAG